MKIFVSYTTINNENTRHTLYNLSKKLQCLGSVFIDLLNNNEIQNPQKKVLSELDSSDLVILIQTESIEKSRWVQTEINRAKYKNIPIKKIPIIDFDDDEKIFSHIEEYLN